MEFRLPELGEGVHEGELVKWKVAPGDVVKHDQPLCEVMTDKATIEVPSAFDGTVGEIHAKEGEIVKVGQLLLSFARDASASQTSPVKPASVSSPATVNAAATSAATSAALGTVTGAIPASPSTRRMAREAGLDINQVSGSGPKGRVLREDIEKALSSKGKPSVKASVAGGEERVPFRGLRKKIAEKMRLSKDKAAHYTYVEEADATELVKLRRDAKELAEKRGLKMTYLPFVMKALVETLKEFPSLNSTLDEAKGELIFKHYYNIGLSIQTDDGLTAPVIKGVDQKTIFELAAEIEDLVKRARAKQLKLDDFQGGTITLTNAGSIGGLFATPVINYPEVAILGFNKIFRKPVVKIIGGAEQIVIRDWTYFSISLDHRVVDGAVGAEFMKAFIHRIENPALIFLDQ